MKNSIVIAGFAGIGKTTLAKKYTNVIDIESSKYKYDYSIYKNPNIEKLKGNPKRIKNPNFPQNYVNAIKQAIEKYNIVCVWCCEEAIKLYELNDIDFVIFYPDKPTFDSYLQSYYDRGNSKKWIESCQSYYHSFIENIIAKSSYKKVIINNNQRLEDKLIEMKVLKKQ